MPLPDIKTWSNRQVVTDDLLNEQIRDVNLALTSPPYIHCARTSMVTIEGGVSSLITWTSAESKEVTAVSAKGIITGARIQRPGLYWVNLSLTGRVSDAGVSHFQAYVKVNGSHAVNGTTTAEADGFQDTAYASGLLRLANWDLVTTEVYVSAGRTADFAEGSWQPYTCRFSLEWAGGY